MKSKVKVRFVEATNLDELKELTNKELEAIQVNVRNMIRDIRTSIYGTGYLVQITYEEVDFDEDSISRTILKESEID